MITISCNGTSSGYVHYHQKPFWCGGDLIYLKSCSDNFHYQYLYYYLKRYQYILESLSFGSSLIKHLSMKELNKFIIKLPPTIEEQTKIATFLSLIDEKINLEQKLLHYYQLQRQYLLNNMIL